MYEYRFVGYNAMELYDSITNALNNYALQGWRVIGTSSNENGHKFTLERRIPLASDEPEPPIDSI
jgi:hypothetical protein